MRITLKQGFNYVSENMTKTDGRLRFINKYETCGKKTVN